MRNEIPENRMEGSGWGEMRQELIARIEQNLPISFMKINVDKRMRLFS